MLQFLLTLTNDESDQSKIEYIYNKYHDHMMKYAISKLMSMGRQNYTYDAEDAVQNAFIKIVKNIHKFDFNRDEKSIKNYSFTILTNEIYTLTKFKDDFLELDESMFESSQHGILEEICIKDEYDNVVQAIENLSEIYSSTLFLAYCKEMSTNEIAKFMSVSTQTVYARLKRAKLYLLDYLREHKAK